MLQKKSFIPGVEQGVIFIVLEAEVLKKNLVILLFFTVILVTPSVLIAAECDGLLAATEAARRKWMEEDLAMQQETVLKPPASITENLSCFGDFTAGMDISKYDPAAIASSLKKLADSIGNKACQAAKGYLDSNLSQISGAVNSGGQLPYGLGRVYDTRISTSGVSVTGATPSAGGVTSKIPSASSLPKVGLPF